MPLRSPTSGPFLPLLFDSMIRQTDLNVEHVVTGKATGEGGFHVRPAVYSIDASKLRSEIVEEMLRTLRHRSPLPHTVRAGSGPVDDRGFTDPDHPPGRGRRRIDTPAHPVETGTGGTDHLQRLPHRRVRQPGTNPRRAMAVHQLAAHLGWRIRRPAIPSPCHLPGRAGHSPPDELKDVNIIVPTQINGHLSLPET